MTANLHLALPGLLLLASIETAVAGPLMLHPKAEKLPFDHQGPFVTTGDGGVLCIDAQHAWKSTDEGRTWTKRPLFKHPEKYEVSRERALLRTRAGVVVAAWMNYKQKSFTPGFQWGGPPEEFKQWVLPTCVCRSLDDGKTWERPIRINTPWCGCIHSMIETRTGRIVLVGQEAIPAWRHATVMFISDDAGKTWKRSNRLDIGVGRHDHAGSIEGTVVERKDGSLYQLLRTESGYLYEATSKDGLLWKNFRRSKLPSVTCCAQMGRLRDGRIALLWNRPPRWNPQDRRSRFELSLAFSGDECRTWSRPVVIAARYPRPGVRRDERRVSYPYLYERRPGELWITTMQGGLRMKLRLRDVARGEVPLPESIVMFGDSTTAFRPGAVKQVYSVRVQRALASAGSPLTVVNAGVGGNTTADAKARFERDVLRLRPKLVVIQFGINDAAVDVWRKPPATKPRVPLKQFAANLRGMIAAARKRGIKVVLMTANPLRWTPKLKRLYGKPPYDPKAADGFDRPLQRYNAKVRDLAKEMKVPLVDVHAAFEESAKKSGRPVGELLLDGMHPNDAGHKLIAGRLLPVLRATLRHADR